MKILNLRKQSLPFDWLLCNEFRVFEYVNNLINTNFSNFTTNLIYNHREKVISKDYEYVEFFHYDLIKNFTIGRPEDDNKNLVDVMNKRGKRFMDIISNENNEDTSGVKIKLVSCLTALIISFSVLLRL